MAMGETGDRYSGAAITLHWLTAVLIVANLALGLSMVPLPISPRKLQWYAWHKWIGITVFLLTSARLLWRQARPPPPQVAMPEWQRRAALAAHRRMKALLRSFIPSLGMLLLAASQGDAQGLLIDKSEIRFVSKQLGVNVEGRFRKWKANIVFLPKNLAKSKAEFDIDLGSIDLASDESETEIKSQ